MFNQSSVANTSACSSTKSLLSEDLYAANNLATTTPGLGRSDSYDAPPQYPWKEISLMPIGDNDRPEYYVWGMDIDYSYPKYAKFKRLKRKFRNALARGDRQSSTEPSAARGMLAKLFKLDNSSDGIRTLSKLSNKTPVTPATCAVQTRMSVYEFLRLDEDEGDGTVVECIEEVDDEDLKSQVDSTDKWHHKLLKRECKQDKRWKHKGDQTQKMHIIETEEDEKDEKFSIFFR
ncbi:uncharacterized protein V1513DRAFT_319132 [Lipomyces chichibuensis]|uniref:uncharacterized protein n=1 Tax=Lipomyces chichibuensis TaxID=1546026 RepID=UPI003343F888